MKKLLCLAVLSLLATAPVFAAQATVECRNTHTPGSSVKGVTHFLLIGHLEGNEAGRWALKSYKSVYEIREWGDVDDVNSGAIWDFDVLKGEWIENDGWYRPRAYPNHVRFQLPFNSRGRYYFVFPEFVNLDHDEVVDAVAMLYDVREEFGASVPLGCRVISR